MQVGLVAAHFFTFLGVEPQIGRHFRPQEGLPGGPRVALISHRLWQSRFGRDPGIVGRTIDLNTQRVEVVGVMPAGFRLELPAETYAVRDSDIWRPAQINFAQQPPRNLTAYTVFAPAMGPGVGLIGAIAVGGAATGLLYEVSTLEPATYGAAVLCVTSVAVAACWLPAHRASRIDPQAGLRQN